MIPLWNPRGNNPRFSLRLVKSDGGGMAKIVAADPNGKKAPGGNLIGLCRGNAIDLFPCVSSDITGDLDIQTFGDQYLKTNYSSEANT